MDFIDRLRRYKWDLGIALESEGHRYDTPNWKFYIVEAPRNKWYADPFILDVTDNEIIILVEEYTYKINYGRLAKLVIDKNTFRTKSERIILDLPTHLSFPAIVRIDGIVYVYPENSASGKSILYRYNTNDDSLVVENTLCELPLTDAVIKELFGRYYLFATKIPTQNGNELTLYESDEITGLYRPIQEIRLPDNTARSAGDIFIEENKVIRPAQNCNGGYGVGLVFQRLSIDQNGDIHIEEILRKQPLKGYEGMHTYNTYKGYTVIDLHKRRHPMIHKLLKSIKHLFLK